MCRRLDAEVCSDENQKDAAYPREEYRVLAIFGFLLLEWMFANGVMRFEISNNSIPRIHDQWAYHAQNRSSRLNISRLEILMNFGRSLLKNCKEVLQTARISYLLLKVSYESLQIRDCLRRVLRLGYRLAKFRDLSGC